MKVEARFLKHCTFLLKPSEAFVRQRGSHLDGSINILHVTVLYIWNTCTLRNKNLGVKKTQVLKKVDVRDHVLHGFLKLSWRRLLIIHETKTVFRS